MKKISSVILLVAAANFFAFSSSAIIHYEITNKVSFVENDKTYYLTVPVKIVEPSGIPDRNLAYNGRYLFSGPTPSDPHMVGIYACVWDGVLVHAASLGIVHK